MTIQAEQRVRQVAGHRAHTSGRLRFASLSAANVAFAKARESTSGAPFRLVLLRNYTADYLVPFLKAHHASSGILTDVVLGNYGAMAQDIMDDGLLGEADAVVVSLVLENLRPDFVHVPFSGSELARELISLAQTALSRTSAQIILNTFLRPVHESAGLVMSLRDDSADRQIMVANEQLREFARSNAARVQLVDWDRLAMMVGMDQVCDRRMGYLVQAPFRYPFLDAYAFEITKVARTLRGRVKKCVILDCDETLWGGIVGEVGPEGIALDRNDYPGKAFYDFQRSLLRLQKRGIMLAVCSKNNPEDVFEVLDNHPHSLLRREHLAAWQVNWHPKHENVAAIIRQLNIGADSVVFVDDNPTECATVATFLPDVTVRQVPADLFMLGTLLDEEGLFDSVGEPTAEDRKRTELMQQEQKRSDAAASFGSLEEFLASLGLCARIEPVSGPEIPRVAQLTQKTNQFNLTTRRYSVEDITAMSRSPDAAVWAMTAADKFGDLGLSAVLIARRDGNTAIVDSFLMSCRILGRRLERALVSRCLATLNSQWAPELWMAEFIPTSKNGQVADFWLEFGFREIEALNGKKYSASPTELKIEPVPFIEVRP